MNKLLIVSLLFSFSVVGARAQSATEATPDGLTARDAFWSASDLVNVAPNPAAKAASASAPAKKPARTHVVARHKAAPKEMDSTAGETSNTVLAESHRHGTQIDPQLVTTSGYGSEPHLVRVSATTSAQPF